MEEIPDRTEELKEEILTKLDEIFALIRKL